MWKSESVFDLQMNLPSIVLACVALHCNICIMRFEFVGLKLDALIVHSFRIDFIKSIELNWHGENNHFYKIELIEYNVECVQCPAPEKSNNLQLAPIIPANLLSLTFGLSFHLFLYHFIWFNFPLIISRFKIFNTFYPRPLKKCHVSMFFQLNAKTLTLKTLKMIMMRSFLLLIRAILWKWTAFFIE